jgi:hypothetical protein
MSAQTSKFWEAGSDGPAIRLETEQTSGYQYVYFKRRDGAGWETTGTAEVAIAMGVDRRGDLADDVAAEWAWTEYRVNGDRVKVSRRLVVEDTDEGALEVRLEEQREEVLGFGDREEYDWRPERWWEFTYESVAEYGGGSE